MPIVTEIAESNSDYVLGVWEITETEQVLADRCSLTAEESHRLVSMTHPARRLEFLTTRVLVHTLAPGEVIRYDDAGKPHLESGRHISISHSQNRVAVILSFRFQVGIDIEKMRATIHRLAPKFVSEKDRAAWQVPLSENDLHVIWGAKEVLFKLYSLGEVDFRKHMHVAPVDSTDHSLVRGFFEKSDFRFDTLVHHRLMDYFMLTWACLDTGS